VLQAAQIAQEDVAPLGGLARYSASLKQICAATRVARWFIFYPKSQFGILWRASEWEMLSNF
jgi:hypothetical protein